MPNIANITIKKNDGTTDIVYAAVVASAGDKSPARWRSPIGAAPAFKPELSVVTSSNAKGTVRRVLATVSYPITATGTDGKTSVVDKPIARLDMPIPQGMAQSDIDEYVSQTLNLFGSAHFRDQAKSAYAST